MTDLIKRLRANAWVAAQRNGVDYTEAADRLTAMKAAGDGLAGLVFPCDLCLGTDMADCNCGLSDKLKQWKEASDGL